MDHFFNHGQGWTGQSLYKSNSLSVCLSLQILARTLYRLLNARIRQWTMNLYTSLIMINIINHSVEYNYWLKSLEPTKRNMIKVPKVFKSTFRYQFTLQFPFPSEDGITLIIL